YTYDKNGNVIRKTYNDEYIDYTYDEHGNLVKWQGIVDGWLYVVEAEYKFVYISTGITNEAYETFLGTFLYY
ncbi:MAG: hypothetical protein J6S10_04670, partial [Clostridia bacterium]|nr:hypothetical protein [Clostridia bacterium]